MTMEIVGNDAQFNSNVTILKDLEIYGDIKNKTKDTLFDFSDNFSFKIQGDEKLRITSDSVTFTDTVTTSLVSSTNVSVAQSVTAIEYYGTFKGSIDPSVANDKISEGNSSAEVVDTGSDGHFKVITEGTERLRITSEGINVTGLTTTTNLAVAGVTTFYGDVNFTGASYNLKWDKSQNSLEFKDETKATFGNGRDLQISHTNSLASQNDSNGDSIVTGDTSFINENGTGSLIFKTNGGPGEGAYQFFDTSWRPILKLFSGSSARAALYHGGSEKLVTTEYGIDVTGICTASNTPKAFVNFDGTTNTGGNCTIRDSHNVSSVTDGGTGFYTINFSKDFANTNYITTVGHSNDNNNGSTHGVLYTNVIATGYVEVINFADSNSNDRVDKVMISVVIHAT